jgi:hypothetical protein
MNNIARIFIMTSGGEVKLTLSHDEANRLRSEYTTWLNGGISAQVFHFADEHDDQFLRFDAIQYLKINVKQPATTRRQSQKEEKPKVTVP